MWDLNNKGRRKEKTNHLKCCAVDYWVYNGLTGSAIKFLIEGEKYWKKGDNIVKRCDGCTGHIIKYEGINKTIESNTKKIIRTLRGSTTELVVPRNRSRFQYLHQIINYMNCSSYEEWNGRHASDHMKNTCQPIYTWCPNNNNKLLFFITIMLHQEIHKIWV